MTFVLVQCLSLVPWLALNNMFDRYLLLIIPFVMAAHIAPIIGNTKIKTNPLGSSRYRCVHRHMGTCFDA